MLAKIDGDYSGALKHWGERMHRWRFVHNDQDGLPPDVVQRLTDLNDNAVSVVVDAFGYAELRERVFELNLQQLEDLFGYAPTRTALDRLGFEALRPVLEEIATGGTASLCLLYLRLQPKNCQRTTFQKTLPICFVKAAAASFSSKSFSVSYPDPDFGEEIAQGFRDRYAAVKAQGASPDEIFHRASDALLVGWRAARNDKQRFWPSCLISSTVAISSKTSRTHL